MAFEAYENFVAIFSKEGTDIESTKDYFMKKGAKTVQTSTDYVIIDDDPDKAISFFVEGMTWNQALKCRLEMGLRRDPRLPDYHYICLY